MRDEREMLELIVGVARKDDRIRAVYMNGSRTNRKIGKDIFQDYDIVYVVRENRPFYEDTGWIDVFGKRLYMQRPDEVDRCNGLDVDFDRCYGWLMQFRDGNRLDLHVVPIGEANVQDDRLCVILLDKDGILPEIPEPSDEDYRIRKPTQREFRACCNEFWWGLNNVAKGLWRDEIPYVHRMFYEGSHSQLMKMLNWKVGYETDFRVSTGKASRFLKDYLDDEVWNRFLETYIGGSMADIWKSVFVMCDLFSDVARELAERRGHEYDAEEAEAARAFLSHVRTLPRDAASVF